MLNASSQLSLVGTLSVIKQRLTIAGDVVYANKRFNSGQRDLLVDSLISSYQMH